MVTDRDLVLQVVAKDLDPHKVPVADVCTQDPVTVGVDESLDDALRRMAKEQVRRLPVVSDGRLVGILAQADVARKASAESTGRLVEEISVEEIAERAVPVRSQCSRGARSATRRRTGSRSRRRRRGVSGLG